MQRMERRAKLSRRAVLAASGCALALRATRPAGAGEATSHWPDGANWDAVAPASLHFDPGKLSAAMDSIMAKNSFSCLVLRDGEIAAETYAAGNTANSAHEIASAAKSVVSVLVGIAIDQGRIRSVDQPACDLIPQWRGTPKAAITIRHLLTMTSGIDFAGLKVRAIEGDQFAINAAAPLAYPPGTHWAYATPMFHLLYHVVERAVGEPFADFAHRVLLGPLGVENWSWLTNVGRGESGPVTNYYSALCSTRDLARFGLFALHGGRWKDRQLVDADYFQAAVSPSQSLNPAYGYLWWENAEAGPDPFGGPPRHAFGNAPKDTFGALGAGGQIAIAVPSLALVVVRQGPVVLDRVPARDWIEPVVAALA